MTVNKIMANGYPLQGTNALRDPPVEVISYRMAAATAPTASLPAGATIAQIKAVGSSTATLYFRLDGVAPVAPLSPTGTTTSDFGSVRLVSTNGDGVVISLEGVTDIRLKASTTLYAEIAFW